MIQKFLRVDHAGEVGANDIYAGQLAVLGRSEDAPLIQVRSSHWPTIHTIYRLKLSNHFSWIKTFRPAT